MKSKVLKRKKTKVRLIPKSIEKQCSNCDLRFNCPDAFKLWSDNCSCFKIKKD